MVILIKNADIPKCCKECKFKYAIGCRTYTGFHHQDTERAAKCPLVETVEVQDAVSRQAVLDKAYAYGNGYEPDGFCVDVEDIQALPSVQPESFLNECDGCFYHNRMGTCDYCMRAYPDRYTRRKEDGCN